MSPDLLGAGWLAPRVSRATATSSFVVVLSAIPHRAGSQPAAWYGSVDQLRARNHDDFGQILPLVEFIAAHCYTPLVLPLALAAIRLPAVSGFSSPFVHLHGDII